MMQLHRVITAAFCFSFLFSGFPAGSPAQTVAGSAPMNKGATVNVRVIDSHERVVDWAVVWSQDVKQMPVRDGNGRYHYQLKPQEIPKNGKITICASKGSNLYHTGQVEVQLSSQKPTQDVQIVLHKGPNWVLQGAVITPTRGSHSAVAGAIVSIDGTNQKTITGKNGEFKLYPVDEDSYQFKIHVTKDGFGPATQSIEIYQQSQIYLYSNYSQLFVKAREEMTAGNSGKAEDYECAGLAITEKTARTDWVSYAETMDAYKFMIDLCTKQKRDREVEKYYEKELALSYSPNGNGYDDETPREALIKIYFKRKDLQKAVQLFIDWDKKEASRHDGIYVDVFDRIKKESIKNHWPELLLEYSKAKLSQPKKDDSSQSRYQGPIIDSLIAQKRYAEALPMLRKIMNEEYIGLREGGRDHEFFEPYKIPRQTALCERQLGNSKVADKIEAVAKARENHPESKKRISGYANGHSQSPQYYLFEQHRENAIPHLQTHDANTALNELDSAEKLYSEMAYAPEYYYDVMLLCDRAHVLMKLANDLPGAEKCYRQALEIADKHHESAEWPLSGLIDILKKTGRTQEAEAKYDRRLRSIQETGHE